MGSYQRIFPPPEPSTQQPASGAARSTTNTAHTHTSKLGYYLNLICETANWSSETNSTKARREFLAKKREKEAEKQRKFDDWKLRRQRSNPHVHAKISTTIDKSVLAMSRRAISMSDVHVRRRYELVYRVRGFSKSPYGLHGGGGAGAGGDAGHIGTFEAAMAPLAHPLLPPPPVSVPPGFWTTAQGGAHQQLQLQLALHQQQVLMAQQMQNNGSGSGGSGSGGGRSKQLMPIKVKNLNDSFKGGWEPHASSAGGASGGSGGGLASTANSMFATLVGANGTGSGSGGGSGGVGGGSGNGDVGVGVSFLGTSPFSGRGMTGSKGVPAALMRMAATTNAASGGDRGGDRGSNASSGGLRIPAGPPGPLGSLLLATMSNNGTGSGTGSSSNLYSGRSSLTTVGGSGNGASGKLGSSGSSSKAGDGSSARLSSSTYASSGSSAASWSAALPSDLMSATVRRTPRARMQTSATDSIMASSSSPSARMMQYDRPAAAGRPSQSQSQSQSQGAAPIGGKQASRVRPASTGSGGMRHAYRTGKSDAAVTSAFPINISPGHGHGRTAGHAAGAGHLPASKQMFWRVPDLDRGERVDK
ncbi:hypothetical protein BC831DRAFT_479737 [Entophlyctis helioformis]|nr:hypothetical protein BC831DRAFT_479737 [Entophlyctis helioformis]